MKIFKINIAILSACFVFFVTGCCKNDEEPQLPPITQIGADTFGCLVDGNIWLPRSIISFPSPPKVFADLRRTDALRIYEFGAGQGHASSFYFGINEDSLKEGRINIPVDEFNDIGLYFFSKKYEGALFVWNKELQGELIITRLDTSTRILSGTFWFDAVNTHNDTVKIRDGRFDLKIDQIDK